MDIALGNLNKANISLNPMVLNMIRRSTDFTEQPKERRSDRF